MELFDGIYDIKEIRMTIYQPRRENVSTYSMTKEELLAWAEEVLVPTAKLAYEGKGEFKAGEHCQFCKIKATCRKRAEYNLELARYDFEMPDTLDEEEIAAILPKIDSLVSWAGDVKEYALQQALSASTTFAEVYKLLLERKEASPKGMTAAVLGGFSAAYKRCEPFHDMPIADIKANMLQAHMDSMTADASINTLRSVRNLLTQMWTLAEEYELAPRNIVKFVRINKADDTEHSEAFTKDELRILWDKQDDIRAARLLVMCLSGFRISEFGVIDIDLDKRIFRGGIKTSNGRNRVVPIHSEIYPLVIRLIDEHLLFDEPTKAIRSNFRSDLMELGILPKSHTPHDCRATFASLCSMFGLPDLHIKRMMGHSTGDLTKDTYTEVFVDDLRKSLEKISLQDL